VLAIGYVYVCFTVVRFLLTDYDAPLADPFSGIASCDVKRIHEVLQQAYFKVAVRDVHFDGSVARVFKCYDQHIFTAVFALFFLGEFYPAGIVADLEPAAAAARCFFQTISGNAAKKTHNLLLVAEVDVRVRLSSRLILFFVAVLIFPGCPLGTRRLGQIAQARMNKAAQAFRPVAKNPSIPDLLFRTGKYF
jgi:hypothetical protein